MKLCLSMIARKIFIDKEIITDTVLRDNPQLREELHSNLARENSVCCSKMALSMFRPS